MLHEAAFAAVLTLIWARLAACAGLLAAEILVYAALLLAIPAGIGLARWAARRWGGAWPGRARLFAFVPLMWFVFGDLRRSIPLFHAGPRRRVVAGLGPAPAGLQPARPGSTGGWVRWPTEALSLCYSLFFVYLLAAATGWLFAPRRQGAGLLRRAVHPVRRGVSPATSLCRRWAPMPRCRSRIAVQGWGVTRLLLAVVPSGTNRADAFPSLHCAVTAFILGFDIDRRSSPPGRLVRAAGGAAVGVHAGAALPLRGGRGRRVHVMAALCLGLAAVRLPRVAPYGASTLPFPPANQGASA